VQLAAYLLHGDAAPLYDKLSELPVNALGLDFVRSPRLAEVVIADGAPLPLGLGLIDAQRPELEDCTALARLVEKLMPKIGGSKAYLGPTGGLESLPRPLAQAKLTLLSLIRKLAHG
jgi:methionine synthase II (cobalamin-independent)